MTDNKGYEEEKQKLRDFLESHYAEDEDGRKVCLAYKSCLIHNSRFLNTVIKL